MKKSFFGLLLAAMIAPAASAQYSYNGNNTRSNSTNYWESVQRTWSNTTYKNLAYITDEFETTSGLVNYESDWGAGLEIGNQYMFPTKPIMGFMKFSFDIDWLDLSYVKYKDPTFVGGYTPEGEPASRVDMPNLPSISFGGHTQQVTAGLGCGFGFHIAPFAKLGAALQPLRVQAYARVIPSFSGIIASDKDNDETVFKGAFMPILCYGFGIDYKQIGIGVQVRNGQAKYDDFLDMPGSYTNDGKVKFQSNSTRFYISFHI